MADTKITTIPDGPILIEGDLELNGMKVEKEKIFLCRCGGSNNKPFCDGTHKKIEFKG